MNAGEVGRHLGDLVVVERLAKLDIEALVSGVSAAEEREVVMRTDVVQQREVLIRPNVATFTHPDPKVRPEHVAVRHIAAAEKKSE